VATVSDFAPLVRGSHTARFRVVSVDGFQTGDDPTGVDLLITGGGVEFDATADVRATGDITVIGEWPRANQLRLGPYGNEVFLARGVETGATGVLWSALGYYRISKTGQSDAARGPLTLSLEDRMATLIESRFTQPRQWVQGTSVGDIIDEIVREVYPLAEIIYDDDSNLAQIGRSLISEESRFEVLKTLAEGLGKIFYWNDIGQLEIRTAPDENTIMWTVDAGSHGVMVNADRTISRNDVYNAVVVTGEGADSLEPVRAMAFDAQESSPTFFGGPFGRIPRFYSSPFITTQLQAENAAVNLLRQSLGAPYDVGLSTVPNPGARPYDVMRVVYNDGTRETHITKRASIPLDVNTAVRIATRQSTIVHVGVT